MASNSRFFFVFVFISSFFISRPVIALDLKDSVSLQKKTREFLIHVPDAVAQQEKLPVVLVFHGGGGNADQVRKQTGMDSVADHHGFMAVYPEGTAALLGNMRTWNAGVCCGVAKRDNIDDIGFVSALIDKLVEQHHADPARIYATGHSNGAMMSYRLACELSDKIRAIAPNSGQRVFQDCHPSRPVPVMHIHGTADPCALYGGGQQCGGCFSNMLGLPLPGDKWPCFPVREIVAEHAKINGCAAETEIVFTKGAVACERFKSCPPDATVVLCSIKGAGHIWAGSDDKAFCAQKPRMCSRHEKVIGTSNNDVNAGELMWGFFKDFR